MDGELLDLLADDLGFADAALGQDAAHLLPQGSQIGFHMREGGLGRRCIGIERTYGDCRVLDHHMIGMGHDRFDDAHDGKAILIHA